MTYALRDYQQFSYDQIFGALQQSRSTLLVLPTGTGKTIIFGCVARDWPTGRVLIVVHRDELKTQAAEKVGEITGEACAIEMGSERSNEGRHLYKSHVVVTSVQTMSRPNRHARFDPQEFGLIIFDEAHHAISDTYLRVLGHFRANPNLKTLGVTATADRLDEEKLGQVFASVAHEYNLKDAIDDGWLVPIQQQLVWVDGLDFSHCRTTAGDLNQSDLAKIMEMEQALHGVVVPTIKIAGDRKTLFFTASVAQAERGSEIANRYESGSAKWICGTTPMDERREILKRYARGEFLRLFNCAIALEGFDEPGIQVVAMARPTKSRALYAQAIGRGTRPLAGIVDPFKTPESRREAIAASAKPNMLVLDYVGNSGRHKLMHCTDVLGVDYDDSILEDALREIEERSEAGAALDVNEAFDLAEERRVEAKRLKAELLEKQETEEALRRRDAKRRHEIKARAKFGSRSVDPFLVFDLLPKRVPGWHKGRRPTIKMLAMLRNVGVSEPELEKISFSHSQQLIKEIISRRDNNLCTFKQAKTLGKFGYPLDTGFSEASDIITALAKNSWQPLLDSPAKETDHDRLAYT